MKEQTSILNVLMYLFHHDLGDHREDLLQKEQAHHLSTQLQKEGFSQESVQSALDWITHLKQAQASLENMPGFSPLANRVFTAHECSLLSTDCRSYLLNLRQMNILTPYQLEMVLDLVIRLESEGIDLSLIQWVALMVLYNTPDAEAALANMELLVLSHAIGEVH